MGLNMFDAIKKTGGTPENAFTFPYWSALRRRATLPRVASALFVTGDIILLGAGILDLSKWYYAAGASGWLAVDGIYFFLDKNPRALAVGHLLAVPCMGLSNYARITDGGLVDVANMGVYAISRFFGGVGEYAKVRPFKEGSYLHNISCHAGRAMFITGNASRLVMISRSEGILAGVLALWSVADILLARNIARKPIPKGSALPAPGETVPH